MAAPLQIDLHSEVHLTANGKDAQPMLREKTTFRVYLMDLWSFIPYYMAHLFVGLRSESIDASLGTVRYHLDREYFLKAGLTPDPFLFDSGGRFRSHFFRRLVKSAEYVMNLLALAIRFTISRPDIVHVQYLRFLDYGHKFEIWFLKYAHYLGVRIVYTVHNVMYQDSGDRHKPVYLKAYALADALICHGEEARAQLNREFSVPAPKIYVIPHGPLFDGKPDRSPQEARAKLGLPVDETLVLSLGVISEYKGIPFLLDAWKNLVQSGSHGRLLIAGTGDERLLASIREKVLADGLEHRVDLWLRFIPVEQLPILYQAADILVFPYKAGTTSGALLTGLNYGKAIVATTLPFFREHLEDKREALLVDYGDLNALSNALSALVANPHQRDRIGRAVAERRGNHPSWKNIARSTIQVYKRTLCLPTVQNAHAE